MSTNKIRILLADDHSFLRMGLAALIAAKDDMVVVGEAKNGREAVEQARKLRPDVIVMDLMMPKMSGAEATKVICGELPDTKVMILTSFGNSAELSQALANGATGVLLKDAATNDLVTGVRKVAQGGRFVPAKIHAINEAEPSVNLTDKQRDILESVTRGLSNADIARQFGIAEITVKGHLSVIFAKLGAATRAEAAAIALRRQLLKT